MPVQVCEEIGNIDKTLKRLAALKLQCCFAKSDIEQDAAKGIRCWCYSIDVNGADIVMACSNRVLIVDENALGYARYSFKES